MSDRKAVIKAWSSQYRKTSKKGKGRILDELVALTGYNRWYVVGLLRWDGKVIRVGRRVHLVGDLRKKVKRTRQRLYGEAELDAAGTFRHQARSPAQAPDTDPYLCRLEREASGVCGDRPGRA